MKFVEALNDVVWYKKLEILRNLKEWTQAEAAERCSVNQKVYWDWEKGKRFPRANNRKRISRVFGLPEEEIFPLGSKLYNGQAV